MSDRTEQALLEQMEEVTKWLPSLKILFGGAITVGVAVVAVTVWVAEISGITKQTFTRVQKNQEIIQEISDWKIAIDVDKFGAKDASLLDKRLSSLEQSQKAIQQTLARIEDKL